MKRVVVTIVAAVALYCAAAYAMGYAAERSVRDLIAQLQEQSSIKNARIVDYRRGVFASDVRIEAGVPTGRPDVGELQLTVQSHLRHGPLLFVDGIEAGAFAATAQPSIKTGHADIDRAFVALFGATLGTIDLIAHLDHDYRLNWRLPAIATEQDGMHLSIAESIVRAAGNYRDLDITAHALIGRTEASGNDRTVGIAPIVMDVSTRRLEAGLDIANVDMRIAQLDIAGDGQRTVRVENVVLRQAQTENGTDIDTAFHFSIGHMAAPVAIDNLHYDMAVSGLSRDAIKRLTALFENLPPNPDERQAFIVHQYKRSLALLPRDATLRIDAGAQYAGVAPLAQLLLQYQPPADGRSIDAIIDAGDFLQLADGALLIRAPVPLIPEALISPYIGQYVAREGNDYVLRASLQQGALAIGDAVIPKEAIAALYEGFKNGGSAPQATPAARPHPALTPQQRALRQQKQLRTL